MPVLYVQSIQANSTTANPSAVLVNTPIAGNLLVATFSNSTANTTTATITGWTALTASGQGTNARSIRMFYKIATGSESKTVTVTAAASTATIGVIEYSGIDPVNPLVVESSASPTTAASTSYTTPSVTTTSGLNILVVASVYQRQTTTAGWTAQSVNASTTGVVTRVNANVSGTSTMTMFDLTVASSGTSYVATATQATSQVGGGSIAVFRAASIPGKYLASETWTGTTGAAWPAQWSQTANGTDGTATIQANAGRLTTSTNSYAYGGQKITAVSSANQRMLVDINLNGDGTEQYVYFGIRSSGAFGSYYPAADYYIAIKQDGTSFDVGGHVNYEYGIQTVAIPSGSASATLHFDAAVIGTQITVYAWVGATKPSTPSFDYNESSNSVAAAGTITLYQSNGTTGIAHNATYDNLHLTTGLELTNSVLPTISGTAATGQVLSSTNGTWNTTPDSYIYQWFRSGLPIAGATSSTYTLTSTDVGYLIGVYTQSVKAGYKNGAARSATVTAQANGIVNSTAPVISGTATVGSTLTTTNGAWTNSPTAYTYQWNRNGVAISGATASTYTLVTADGSTSVTATVTATRSGYASGTATSNALTIASAFSNTGAPTITGTAIVGQTATVSNGTWTMTPDSYTYQWNRDGTAISGATASTYSFQTFDQGLPITATVTAIKSGYDNATATSAAVTPSAVSVSDKMGYWKTALSNRATAPATVTVTGGAIAEGQGASIRDARWVSRLRDMLRRNYRTTGVVGGEGYIPAEFSVQSPSSPWAGWMTSGTGTYGYDQWSANLGYRQVDLDVSTTLVYTFTGTDIDIWYTSGYGAFSYKIDSGSATTVDSSGSYLTSNYVSATGLTAGTHTVTIATDSNNAAVLNGFFIYNGDRNKGIRLADASHTTFALSQFTGDLDHYSISLTTTNASLFVLEFGGVDAQQISPAVFQKQLQNFVNFLQAAYTVGAGVPSPSILIVATYLPNTSVTANYLAPWSQYVTAMQTVANYAQVGFLDLGATLPQADTSGSGYYLTDGIYPNDFGQAKIAQLVFNAISDSNASSLNAYTNWYQALTKRATTPAKWFAIGDSLTEGQGASGVTKRWISQTIGLLQANYPVLGVNGGVGFKPGQYNVNGPDSLWTDWYTATSGTITTGNTGAGPGYRLTYFAAGATRTYPFYGTDIDVWVYNNGGTLSYSVDGGTATVVATSSNGSTTISSKTGLTRGNHSITLTATTAVGISGFMIYDGDKAKGIQLYDSGRSGSTTSLFLADLTNFVKNITTVAPDLVTIELGPNDMATDSVSTVFNNLVRLAGTISDITKTPSMATLVPYLSTGASGVSTQAQYNEAYKMIAQAVGGAAIDFGTFMPTADSSGTGYYSTDAHHPNDSGQTRIANNVVTTLADTRITPSSAGKVLATETWTLPNGSSWPAQWTVTTNSGAAIDVQNSKGHILSTTASYSIPGSTYLSGMAATKDAEIQMDFMIPNTSIEQYPLVGMRVQSATFQSNGDPTTGYIFNVYPNLNQIEVLLSSSFTSLQKVSFTFTSGVTYSIRWQLIGSTAKVRIWAKSGTEPTTWNINTNGATDQTPGKVTVFTENGPSGSAAEIYYDNLTVLAISSKVYVGNKLLPLGYVGSHPITAMYVGSNKVQ